LNTSFALGALLVFSPHMDDAVFSCADLIARHPGAEVATVFAAAPEGYAGLTPWDAAAGFHGASQAIAWRRDEDRTALSLLRARPRWLPFCDAQYEATPSRESLQAALAQLLRETAPNTVLLPAGLFHSDHVLLHDALLAVRAEERPGVNWLMYEEALYRRIPGLLQQRLAQLQRDGIAATPLAFPPPHEPALKQRAIACYASQLRALAEAANGCADVFAPERYWLLAAQPDGAAA